MQTTLKRESLFLGMFKNIRCAHAVGMQSQTPYTTVLRQEAHKIALKNNAAAAVLTTVLTKCWGLIKFIALTAFICSANTSNAIAADATLELDSAHVLAARATGFGFTIREISYPARCVSEHQSRANLITLTLESDRSQAWSDVTCEHKLFENRTLQNGWVLARFELKRQCLASVSNDNGEQKNWKRVADDNCLVQLTPPMIGGSHLTTSVTARLKGSGPLASQARRLEVTYQYTISGPSGDSPWSSRR